MGQGGSTILILDEGDDWVPFKFFSALKGGELYQKNQTDDHAAEFLNQVYNGLGGPPGSQEVVDYQDLRAFFKGVLMDLQGILAILEVICHGERLVGELPFFPDRHHARLEFVRDSRAEDETPRLDAHHSVYVLADELLSQFIHGLSEGVRMIQKSRYILKYDPFFRKAGDIANMFF